MLFNSYIFILCFLPLTLMVYFGLNHINKYELAKLALIIASLIFYGFNEIKYVLVILSSILLNFSVCTLLKQCSKWKKPIVVIGVIANLSLLGYFKYFDFLLENINALAGSNFNYLNLALPLGISFFTFQQISYLIDTSKGECSSHNFYDYVLFVTFFPQLVAGPIVSHDEVLPQFASTKNKALNFSNLTAGIQAFSIGLFKKVIIADNFGKIVSYGYGHISSLNSLEAILVILAYTIQIYFDFSGYCDMATGIALMFNIKLPMNFNSPYKATNIVEFWKRWHITLTRFLTRYVYIPLGGNRKGNVRTYINILIVFLLSGLWHGAGYTFILWGFLHGIANVLCRLYGKTMRKLPKWLSWSLTFAFLNVTWTVFRAESIEQAWNLLSRVVSGGFSINAELTETLLQPTLISIPAQFIPFAWVVLSYTVGTILLSVWTKNTNEMIENHKTGIWSLLWSYGLFMISVLSLSGISTFLYFNF